MSIFHFSHKYRKGVTPRNVVFYFVHSAQNKVRGTAIEKYEYSITTKMSIRLEIKGKYKTNE